MIEVVQAINVVAEAIQGEPPAQAFRESKMEKIIRYAPSMSVPAKRG